MPHIYQQEGAQTTPVEGAFVLTRGREVRFRIGLYDRRVPLVIDPKLSYSAGFGGSGINWNFPQTHLTLSDTGTALAVDRAGNAYVVGTTFSADFPLLNASAPPPNESCKANCVYRSLFIAKLAADGGSLLYATYLAAPSTLSSNAPSSFLPLPAGIAVDAAGNASVTGTTSGENFPFTGHAVTAGGNDAFAVELDNSGALVAATLIGGSGDDAGTSIAFGPGGFLYVAGTTQSADLPTTPGAYRTAPPAAGQNIFLTKLALPSATDRTFKTAYLTYLGPGDSPAAAVDASGFVYVGASTTSTAWPTGAGAVQPACAGTTCADLILLKINPAGSQLVFATYFGGTGAESIGGVAVDGSGSMYFTGTTTSTDLQTTPETFQPKWNPNPNLYQPKAAFVGKIAADSKLSYASYLAGSSYDQSHGIALDSAGDVYIGGETASVDFPVVNGIQQTLYNYICPIYTPSGTTPSGSAYCASAGFVSAVNPTGSGLLWSTYLGSGGGRAVAVDPLGNVYTAGVNIDLTAPPLAASATNSIGVVKIAPGSTGLQFSWNGITSAAAFHPGLPAPGGLASVFVHGLAVSGILTPNGYPLPTELGGVSILVRGVPVPILAVANIPTESPLGLQQINFQVPFESVSNLGVNFVEVRYQGNSTFAIPQTVGPGIFVLNDGTPAIQHATDYSLVTPSNPAKRGETIIIYLTGLGPVTPQIPSGTPASGAAAITQPACNQNPFTPLGTTLYAGLSPGYVGLYQMNVQLRDDLPQGSADLYVYWTQCWFGVPSDNFAKSNTVSLPVQ